MPDRDANAHDRPSYAELAVVQRSGFVESRHFGSLVAVDGGGDVVLALGRADEPVLPRSAAKPVQALGCLLAGAPLRGPSLAIAAGSHTGEDWHAAVVRRLLAEVGLDAGALKCPAALPEDPATRRRQSRTDQPPDPVRMNCSGKHAAMLAACVRRGWPVPSYLEPDHPLQRLVRRTSEQLAEAPAGHVAVDGCGAPVTAITLAGLARSIRALVIAPAGPRRLVADAMRSHPYFVGGSGHPNTEVMRRLRGVVCKGGAEGVIVAAAATGAAVAVKVIDGSSRSTTMIALAVLRRLGVDTRHAAALAQPVVSGGGRPVGVVRAGHDLARALPDA